MSIGKGLVWLFRKIAAPAPPRALDGICTIIAVTAIRCYRVLLSPISGRRCMFRLGCSRFALERLQADGWRDGRADAIARLDQCNGHYVMSFDGLKCSMTTSDGHVHDESAISPWLLSTYKTDHAQLIERLASGPR